MKRNLRFAAIAAAILLFAWSLVWLYAARHVAARIGEWQIRQAQAGVELGYGEMAVKGWPFGWRVQFDKPRASGAGPSGWSWHGDRLVATVDPRDLAVVAFRLPGEQHIAAGAGDLAVRATLRAAKPEGIVRFDPQGRVTNLAVEFETLDLRVGDGEAWTARRLSLDLAPRRPVAPGPETEMLDIDATVESLRLPGPVAQAAILGRDIARAEITAKLEGPVRGPNLAKALAAWRDAGGTLEIKKFRLEWGTLRVNGDATLALDEQNRPLGAGTARIAGAGDTLDALAQSGAIDPRGAALLKIAINFLARNDPANGGAPSVQIPVTAQDGVLTVQRFPLLKLKPLDLE